MPTIGAEIRRHARAVETRLGKLVPRDAPPALAEPAWYHLSTAASGSRPALCLIACEALGGDARKALDFAAGVELLHNMLLVHDDIEDGDTMRRNKPTVWRAFGVDQAINVGDYLLGRALNAVLRSPVDEATRLRLLEVFLATYERTVEGQALDMRARSDRKFTVDKYMDLVMLKTGHYLVLGMIGGAVIAGAPERTLRCLRRLGESLGPAFQIHDDLIDLTVGKGRGGVKGSDIREGKASILYAHALSHVSRADAKRLVAVMRTPREMTAESDVQWVISLYKRCGAMRFAQEKADQLIAESKKALDGLPAPGRTALRELVTFIAERTT